MNVRIILSLISGISCMLYTGAYYAFSVYTNSIKKKYNYTQSEMEIMSGISNFAAVSIFIPGVMIEKFGVRITAAVAVILSFGNLLMWSATKMVTFYAGRSWLLDIYVLISGLSGVISYALALVPNVNNFHSKYRGTIVGVLDGSYSVGTSIFVAVYGAFFVNSHITDEENQDIGGFFLMLMIIGVVVNSLGFIFINFHRVEDTHTHEQTIYTKLDESGSSATETGENTSMINTDKDRNEITGVALIKKVDFHLIFIVALANLSVVSMYLQNVNVFLKSFHLDEHSTLFNILIPIFGILIKLCCGPLSDAVVNSVPRPAILLCTSVALFTMMLTCMFVGSNFYVLLATTITVGLCFGASWTLFPTIMADYFGLKYFARNYGACAMISGILVIVIQRIFGAIYQAAIDEPGSLTCYGLKCFRWSFLMAAMLLLVGIICNLILIRRRHFRRGINA